jgi:hypothetical protein
MSETISRSKRLPGADLKNASALSALRASSEPFANGLRDLRRGRRAAQVAGVQGRIGGDLFDRTHQALRGSGLTQVL